MRHIPAFRTFEGSDMDTFMYPVLTLLAKKRFCVLHYLSAWNQTCGLITE